MTDYSRTLCISRKVKNLFSRATSVLSCCYFHGRKACV